MNTQQKSAKVLKLQASEMLKNTRVKKNQKNQGQQGMAKVENTLKGGIVEVLLI